VNGILGAQEDICRRFAADFVPTDLQATLAVALDTLGSAAPLHGLRQQPEGGGCGWYIWAGDASADPNFFESVHALYLCDTIPQVLPYLGLGPGWRFLLAPGYEDVWFDPNVPGPGPGLGP
jgi:hypothetical protein